VPLWAFDHIFVTFFSTHFPLKKASLLSQFLPETIAYLRLPVSFQVSAYTEKGPLHDKYPGSPEPFVSKASQVWSMNIAQKQKWKAAKNENAKKQTEFKADFARGFPTFLSIEVQGNKKTTNLLNLLTSWNQ